MTEPERDRWGRYKLTDPSNSDGVVKPWTRATTLANALEDSFGIVDWKLRSVIIGLTSRTDLMDLAYASDPDDKQQLQKLAEDALEAAGANKKANQGTALHKFTARLDANELSRSPRQWQRHLDAYQEFKQRENILTHPRMIERITVVPDISVAGTMDRIVKHEGEAKIADVKTGNLKYDGLKITIQLAIYSRGAGLWDGLGGKWQSMPKVSQSEGLVFHLPSVAPDDWPEGEEWVPTADLYRVDLDLGWKLAQIAYFVRETRKDKNLLKRVTHNAVTSEEQ